MPLNGFWLFPSGSKTPVKWAISSRCVVAAVGIYSKIWLEWLNNIKVYNKEKMHVALEQRSQNQGLVTVSNHQSCVDDPILWGFLKWKYLLNQEVIRWTLAAHDICYTKYWHAMFFSLGKTVPICRGDGVYQKGMDFMLEKLNKGQWVHMFPEGKVNLTHEFMRLKWGVGRLISECKIPPIVLPMYHLGMDSILPNHSPYIPQIRKHVTLLVGSPVDFGKEIEMLKELKKTPREIRKFITDKIQEELSAMREKAELLHKQNVR